MEGKRKTEGEKKLRELECFEEKGAVRRVVSFLEFGWRGERFTFRDVFLA